MLFDIDATVVNYDGFSTVDEGVALLAGFRSVAEVEAYRELITATYKSPHLLLYVDIGMRNIDVIETCSNNEIDPELAMSLIGDDNQLHLDDQL